jgi:hypothetical protein
MTEIDDRLDRIEAKLDLLVATVAKAEVVVDSFLNGKNAKYLALLAKVKGVR